MSEPLATFVVDDGTQNIVARLQQGRFDLFWQLLELLNM
jgi:hypothetical protein